MAKKAKTAGGKPAKGAGTDDKAGRLIEAALGLAATRGWSDLSLAEIAEEAGLPLSEAYPVFPSKTALLEGFSRRMDAAMLEDLPSAPETDSSARDRLFDVVMARFDAMQPYRLALGNILYDQRRDPIGGFCGLVSLRRSLALMLEAAGLSADGVKGIARVKGLGMVYLGSLRTWLHDESPDMASTMAALDGYLRRIEGLLRRIESRPRAPFRRGRSGDQGPEPGPEPGMEGMDRPA